MSRSVDVEVLVEVVFSGRVIAILDIFMLLLVLQLFNW
jgi:hypothetical protein